MRIKIPTLKTLSWFRLWNVVGWIWKIHRHSVCKYIIVLTLAKMKILVRLMVTRMPKNIINPLKNLVLISWRYYPHPPFPNQGWLKPTCRRGWSRRLPTIELCGQNGEQGGKQRIEPRCTRPMCTQAAGFACGTESCIRSLSAWWRGSSWWWARQRSRRRGWPGSWCWWPTRTPLATPSNIQPSLLVLPYNKEALGDNDDQSDDQQKQHPTPCYLFRCSFSHFFLQTFVQSYNLWWCQDEILQPDNITKNLTYILE